MTQTGLHISDPYSYSEIEKIYENSILTQGFYGENYAPEWFKASNDAKDMAYYIKETFNPKRVIDIGCGIGKLIFELRKLKIDAVGIEFSKSFVDASPVKEYIYEGDIFHLPSGISEHYDLVVCMEVLEHVPPTRLSEAIKELKKISKKYLLITIPCYVPDVNYYGLPLYEKCWLHDAKKNIPFHNLVVDANDVPHLGHISLATRRWWSAFFLLNGLIRKPEQELIGYNHYNFLKYRWNMFLLSFLDNNSINIQDTNFFINGFYHEEKWDDNYGHIRWSMQNFSISIQSTKSGNKITMHFYSGPKELIFNRDITFIITRIREVDLQIIEEKYVIQKTIEPDTKYSLDFDVFFDPFDVINIQGHLNEIFIPHFLNLNGDSRHLGIALSSVQLI